MEYGIITVTTTCLFVGCTISEAMKVPMQCIQQCSPFVVRMSILKMQAGTIVDFWPEEHKKWRMLRGIELFSVLTILDWCKRKRSWWEVFGCLLCFLHYCQIGNVRHQYRMQPDWIHVVSLAAGNSKWHRQNAWSGRPKIKVALRVDDSAVQQLVKDRMMAWFVSSSLALLSKLCSVTPTFHGCSLGSSSFAWIDHWGLIALANLSGATMIEWYWIRTRREHESDWQGCCSVLRWCEKLIVTNSATGPIVCAQFQSTQLDFQTMTIGSFLNIEDLLDALSTQWAIASWLLMAPLVVFDACD